MLTKLGILDFQSIRNLKVELGPITVFVGESDSGKSAVVRALYALAFNDYPSDHVRNGAQYSMVVAQTDRGVVSAEKGPKRNTYSLGAKRWDRVGRDVPEEVAALLGWRVVELDDGTKFAPSIQRQFDGPFLLADSPARVAKVLGSLTNISTLFAAIREGTLEERRSRKAAEAALEEAQRHGVSLEEAISAHERAVVRAERARTALQAVEEAARGLELVAALLTSLEGHRAQVVRMGEALAEARARVVAVPNLDAEVEELVTLRSIESDMARADAECQERRDIHVRAEDQFSVASSALEAYVSGMEFCPVCERPMEGHDV